MMLLFPIGVIGTILLLALLQILLDLGTLRIVFVEIVIVLDLCPVSVLIVAGWRCSRSRDWSGLRRIVFGCWRGRGSRCSAMLRLFCFGCR